MGGIAQTQQIRKTRRFAQTQQIWETRRFAQTQQITQEELLEKTQRFQRSLQISPSVCFQSKRRKVQIEARSKQASFIKETFSEQEEVLDNATAKECVEHHYNAPL